MPDILGYARVSTTDQDLDGQRHRLKDAGAIRIFGDIITGRTFERPGLTSRLDMLREMALRVAFTEAFHSPTTWENLDKETLSSALALIEAGFPPASSARQLGIGRSTLYRVIAERKVA